MDDDLSFDVDLTVEGDNNNFHTKNLPGEDFRRVLAQTTNEKSPLNTRIKLVEVHHGQMVYEGDECEATLLIFEFRFQSRLAGRRYQSISVTLEFLDKGGNSRRDPTVVDLAPDRMHWLNKTTFDRRTKYGASAGLTGGGGVANAETKVEWEMEQTKPLRFKATLTGRPGMSRGKGGGEENTVTWTMEENKDEADGVPSFLQAAVMLKRRHTGAAFIANLRVSSDVDLVSSGLRTLPVKTDKDKVIDPVAFTPGKIQIKNNSVSGVTEDDLQHMETIDITKFFKVNLSEEDPLNAPLQGAAQATGTEGATETVAEKEGEGAGLDAGLTTSEGAKDAVAAASLDDGAETTPAGTREAPAASPQRTGPLHTPPQTPNLHPPPPSQSTPAATTTAPPSATAAITAAAEAARLAARAADTAAQAALAAASAAEAAARAAEAAILAVSKLPVS